MSDKRVLFIQHGDADRPGLLAETLEGCGIDLVTVRSDLGEEVPALLDGFSGLAIGGGAQGVYEQDRYPYLSRECALVRHAAQQGRPVLGLCLGAQIMAHALGAWVRPGQREVGFFDVTFDPVSHYDPLWRGLPERLSVSQWHGDTFDIPPGGMRLASSELNANQLFRYGHALYGLQFHLEMTPEVLEEMVARSQASLAESGVDPARIWQEGCQRLPALRETAATVFGRWAEMLC